jgi:ATP-dependent DNA helicase RecG
MRLFQESGVFHYDKISIEQSKFSSLDLNKVARYFDFFEIKFEEEDVVNILKNIDVLDDLGQHLTVGGNLVFGINPQKFMPEAVISFGRFKGNEISSELIDKKIFEGTLDSQIDNCLSSIKANFLYSSDIEGLKRVDTHNNIPDKVIRELLVNASVHRDYSITGSRIRVFIFDNRLEIRSPGKLPNSVSIDKMKFGVSYARNPIIVKFMSNLRYIDKMGRGIPMIIRELNKIGLSIEFEEVGYEFVATIYLS